AGIAWLTSRCRVEDRPVQQNAATIIYTNDHGVGGFQIGIITKQSFSAHLIPMQLDDVSFTQTATVIFEDPPGASRRNYVFALAKRSLIGDGICHSILPHAIATIGAAW